MDDLMKKLEDIYNKLEADRARALKEYDNMITDNQLIEPGYRHKAREVAGQLLKLAIDASVAQAKVLEPLTKNQTGGQAGSGMVDKKALLDALETLDMTAPPPVAVVPEPIPPMEESVPADVLAAEATEIAELEAQLKALSEEAPLTINAAGGK